VVKKGTKATKKSAAKKTAKKKKSTKKKTKKTAVKKSATRAAPKTARKKKVSKNTSSGKPTAADKPKTTRRRRRKTTLSKAELKHFRELLIEKLKEIIGDVDHIESEALKRSRLDATGDLSSMPIHMADIGSDNYEQEFALGLMNSERKIVLEILAALKRIEEGTYGICEGTGEPVPKARLEGIPWARYCVQYAEMLEKGLVNEEDNWFEYVGEEDEEDETGFDEENEDDDDYDEDEDLFFYGYDDEEEDEEEEFV
jgi:DnaK suppressor protein